MNLQRQTHWPTTVKRGNRRAKFLVLIMKAYSTQDDR
jgi:hypothetical protein